MDGMACPWVQSAWPLEHRVGDGLSLPAALQSVCFPGPDATVFATPGAVAHTLSRREGGLGAGEVHTWLYGMVAAVNRHGAHLVESEWPATW